MIVLRSGIELRSQLTMSKVVRTQSRTSRHVKLAKRRRRTRPLDIAPEFHAPITGEIERQLKQLVAQFGEQDVLETLAPLITKCK